MKYNVDEVKKLVAEVLEVDECEITDNANFVDDLDADSLKALELLAALEKEYDIEISEEYLKSMTSFNNTLQVLDKI